MTIDPFKPILKVLLVDDDPDTRQVVAMMIEKAGHVLIATGSGSAALSLLNREKVDVILLDIMMPEMDGLSILETIRTTSEAPILMLTALSNAAIMEQSYMKGANDYIVKPFTREKLVERIERLGTRAKRSAKPMSAPWTARFWLDANNRLLIREGTAIDLTEIETKLMGRLMETPCMEISDTDLYLAGWGTTEASALAVRSLVDNALTGLQQKLEENPDYPKILIATRDGYTFNPDCV